MPQAIIVSEPFRLEAQFFAKQKGVPGLTIISLPYDPDRMPKERVQELAANALEEVIKMWAQPSASDNVRRIGEGKVVAKN